MEGLLELADEIKTAIPDQQYIMLMDGLKQIHDRLREFEGRDDPEEVHVEDHDELAALDPETAAVVAGLRHDMNDIENTQLILNANINQAHSMLTDLQEAHAGSVVAIEQLQQQFQNQIKAFSTIAHLQQRVLDMQNAKSQRFESLRSGIITGGQFAFKCFQIVAMLFTVLFVIMALTP